ncbi:MAG: LysR family transcriptional regulator [Peptococcaceae bacterium]|nr:LysR family transcriptional regulator [Peptococcaceae bacterium]
MKIEQILYVADIAKTHSITQTAQRFFMSQQALSISLQKLEDEFACVLLDRSNKGAFLTAYGEEFLRDMLPIVHQYRLVKERLALQNERAEALKRLTGTIVIDAHVRTIETFMLDVMMRFGHLCPNMVYTLREKENMEIIDSIEKGEADIGVVFVPEFVLTDTNKDRVNPRCYFESIFSDSFVACLHKNHPLADRERLYFKDISSYDTVLFDMNEQMTMNPKIELGPQNCNQWFSKDVSFHKRLLRANKAISVITTFEFKKVYKEIPELVMMPIEDTMTSNINIVTSSDRALGTAAQAVRELLRHHDFALL